MGFCDWLIGVDIRHVDSGVRPVHIVHPEVHKPSGTAESGTGLGVVVGFGGWWDHQRLCFPGVGGGSVDFENAVWIRKQ